MKNCPENIAALFRFLDEHHEYNKKIQKEDIRRTLSSYTSVPDRARRLLYEIFKTQSQVKLGFMAEFFRSVEEASNQAPPNRLATYSDFRAFLGVAPGQKGGLFEALSKRNGWGAKTSALFIRNLAVIAASPELSRMFWPDIQAVEDEPIRLPVDKVIKAIFLHLRVSDDEPSLRHTDFKTINNYLSVTLACERTDMLIWDDLWFWGFITQKSEVGKVERKYEWNDAKYWSIFTASKTTETIADVELLATGKVTPKETRSTDARVLAENFLSLTGAPVSPAK